MRCSNFQNPTAQFGAMRCGALQSYGAVRLDKTSHNRTHPSRTVANHLIFKTLGPSRGFFFCERRRVRCGARFGTDCIFQNSAVRCGAVRPYSFENPTTVRCGAVLLKTKSYVAVRCGAVR